MYGIIIIFVSLFRIRIYYIMRYNMIFVLNPKSEIRNMAFDIVFWRNTRIVGTYIITITIIIKNVYALI